VCGLLQCLKNNYEALSSECQHTILLEAKVEASSIEMKPAMQAACATLITSACASTPAGGAQLIDCLHDHSSSIAATMPCRAELELDLTLTAKDYRLKYGISHECVADMNTLCSAELDLVSTDLQTHGGTVLSCLVKNGKRITSPTCKNEVKRYQKTVMANWKHSETVKSACSEDVNNLCIDTPPGHGAIHECLLSHINHGELSEPCAKEEFALLADKMDDVTLDEDLLSKCSTELSSMCATEQNGEGGGLSCLEANLISTPSNFRPTCSKKVNEYTRLRNADIRLDNKLMKACEVDSQKLCPPAPNIKMTAEMFQHGVIDCLIENREVRAEQSGAARSGQFGKGRNVQQSMHGSDRGAREQYGKKRNDRRRMNGSDRAVRDQCSNLRNDRRRLKGQKCALRSHKRRCPMSTALCSRRRPLCSRACEGALLTIASLPQVLTSNQCASAVKTKMVQQASDWKANPEVHDLCVGDVVQFCPTVKPGESRVHDCLFENIKQVSKKCANAEFKEQIVKAEDIKFNPKLFRGCTRDIKMWCGEGVADADKISCLQVSRATSFAHERPGGLIAF